MSQSTSAPAASSSDAPAVDGDLPRKPASKASTDKPGCSSLGSARSYKAQEADRAPVPDYPNLVSIPQWRANLLNNVVQASAGPDDTVVMKWIQEALDDSATFDALNSVGDISLTQLDSKLCSSMTAMLNRAGDEARWVKDRADRHLLEHAKQGRIRRGRQLVHLLLDSLKTVDQTEVARCLGHLGNVVLENDDLHGFLAKWNIVLDGLSGGRPADVLLRDTLDNKIRDSPSMVEDRRRYDRLTKDLPDRTYEKLVEVVEAVITTKRQRHNISERDALMMSTKKTTSFAVPAVPAKAGPAKATAKGSGGGVSPPATSTTARRLRFTTGKRKWGDNCEFPRVITNERQKEAVAKFFVRYAEPKVVAAPVTPKAKESTPAPKSEAKGKGRGRSQSREPRERTKKSPCWHFLVGSGCSCGDERDKLAHRMQRRRGGDGPAAQGIKPDAASVETEGGIEVQRTKR